MCHNNKNIEKQEKRGVHLNLSKREKKPKAGSFLRKR